MKGLREVRMIDIRKPEGAVKVEYDSHRKVLYVHVEGMTLLRIQECVVNYEDDTLGLVQP